MPHACARVCVSWCMCGRVYVCRSVLVCSFSAHQHIDRHPARSRTVTQRCDCVHSNFPRSFLCFLLFQGAFPSFREACESIGVHSFNQLLYRLEAVGALVHLTKDNKVLLQTSPGKLITLTRCLLTFSLNCPFHQTPTPTHYASQNWRNGSFKRVWINFFCHWIKFLVSVCNFWYQFWYPFVLR